MKIFVREREAIFDLSKRSQKVFTYMLTKIRYDDLFIFNMEECLEKTGYKSQTPVLSSLVELWAKKFIAKTKNQFVYWINPKRFYKGDRLVITGEYRKAKKDKIVGPNQLDMFNRQVEGSRKFEESIERNTLSLP